MPSSKKIPIPPAGLRGLLSSPLTVKYKKTEDWFDSERFVDTGKMSPEDKEELNKSLSLPSGEKVHPGLSAGSSFIWEFRSSVEGSELYVYLDVHLPLVGLRDYSSEGKYAQALGQKKGKPALLSVDGVLFADSEEGVRYWKAALVPLKAQINVPKTPIPDSSVPYEFDVAMGKGIAYTVFLTDDEEEMADLVASFFKEATAALTEAGLAKLPGVDVKELLGLIPQKDIVECFLRLRGVYETLSRREDDSHLEDVPEDELGDELPARPDTEPKGPTEADLAAIESEEPPEPEKGGMF